MSPKSTHPQPEEDAVPQRFTELHRRGFLIGAAAALAGSVVGCSPTQSNLSGGRRRYGYRTGAKSHQTYRSYIASLRLRKISPDTVLAPHFRTRSGVRNSLPPKTLWANMGPTLRVADEIARRTGSPLKEVSSAYRNPGYNRRVGGATQSQHMRNSALDLKFECGAWAASKAARQLRKEGFFAGGVGIYSSFLHIDTRGTNETWWA